MLLNKLNTVPKTVFNILLWFESRQTCKCHFVGSQTSTRTHAATTHAAANKALRVQQSGRLINKACRESIMWNLQSGEWGLIRRADLERFNYGISDSEAKWQVN